MSQSHVPPGPRHLVRCVGQMGTAGLRKSPQPRGSRSPAGCCGNVGPVSSAVPIFHELVEIWKTSHVSVSSNQRRPFREHCAGRTEQANGPSLPSLEWLLSGECSDSHLPFFVPRNCSQDSRVGLSLPMVCNI